MSFETARAASAAAIEARLHEAIPSGGEPLHAAMRYALQGGKRLRGFLTVQGAALHGLDLPRSLEAAAAIEALHAYSLVHDDLPAMDDDDLRRGRPTVHVEWDEATAILVGDALQSLAFELLCDPRCHPGPAVRAQLALELARAAGGGGMVLGQARDIAAETSAMPLDLEQITALQDGKTGALIRWAGRAGAILGGADPAPLDAYAAALGLAFQITDDILDVTGDEAAVGKRVGKDGAAGKATFVSLLGLGGARRRAEGLHEAACDALASYGAAADPLRELARYVVGRDR
ncbi:polyprenyl synthetase family protein [Profundibacterium mesophilum]|uniref:Geranylgeranyl diphosphate synthase n=1 Tax=Profundibacterium mesophilum KAUST100406-0324 TaxID=1037889 RepID=A0A921NR55_9RHOB|nr:farnesyl diphosphate synthase [Profundibacterium mesophilum]KAF0675932.1 Farnesyl-diphosphate synthase [Profundibacterium mesophilum KAUST100406-0324]